MPESPTFARRQLGLKLRALREAQELKVEQVAGKLVTNATTVRRWENGATGISGPALAMLCTLYDVDDETRTTILSLATQGKKPGWWASFSELPDSYKDLIGMESAADESWNFEVQTLPGLIQTEDYARAMITASYPTGTPDEVEVLVQARIRRQERLTGEDPITMRIVLDESVLHRPIGGPKVMAEQLDRLVGLAAEPNINMQVLPYRAGSYGHSGSFVVLIYPEPAPPVAYVEVLTGDLYQEGAAMRRYKLAHENLRTAAASFEDSLTMIKSARKAMA